jgi:hypothetical protein
VLGDLHVDDLGMLVHGPIHVDAALGEELLKVTVRTGVPQVPDTSSRMTSGGNRNPANAERA